MNPVYLDHAATAPLAPEVATAMQPFWSTQFHNPQSLYAAAQTVREAVATARRQVAALLGAETAEEIYFTSGGTEGNNWALQTLLPPGSHLVTTAIEHPAVYETAIHLKRFAGCEITFLPVDAMGHVAPADLEAALRDNTALVSIMHANNEVGTCQDIRRLADIAHNRDIWFHTDAVQTVGQMPVDVQALGVDLLTLSAHKFGGPKGVGALYVRRGTRLPAFHHGGGQERERRSGTLNVPGIIGLEAACALAQRDLPARAHRMHQGVETLWNQLVAIGPDLRRNGDPECRAPHILSVSVPDGEGQNLVLALDRAGVQISTGAACSTGQVDPSRVLLALGVSPLLARGTLRFSLGPDTTPADLLQATEAFRHIT